MSIALYGHNLAPGFAFGPALTVREGQTADPIQHVSETQCEYEKKRLTEAQIRAELEIKLFIETSANDLSPQLQEFLLSHQMLLSDQSLSHSIMALIDEQNLTAESAINRFQDEINLKMDSIDDSYLKSRKDDFNEVLQRLRNALQGNQPQHTPETENIKDYVIVCEELKVAEVIQWHAAGISGIIAQHGGPLSHATILARSLHLPVISGIENALTVILDDDHVIMDAVRGCVIIDADPKTRAFYQRKQSSRQQQLDQLKRSSRSDAITRDNQTLSLGANAERPEDLSIASDNKAQFIGLYRTEFLYLHRNTMPDENEQYETYRDAIVQLDGCPLTIRTLDLGADKIPVSLAHTSHPDLNPALGLRAIRFSLEEPDIFQSQISAILRASKHGPVRILLPLLSRAEELFRARHQIEQTHQKLCKNGHKAPLPEIGGMIEVPAAAIIARVFAKHLDFLSIGTNDLIQYTLAVDRQDDQVSHLLDMTHPAILRLLANIIETGQQLNTPVAMCGEMAGDLNMTRLLIGLGLKEFSMHPALITEIRGLVRNTNSERARNYANRILRAYNPVKIQQLIGELNEGLD
ncbi:MAG: phosphoenolpyruvate--protein phosphotransferase [bacterium]